MDPTTQPNDGRQLSLEDEREEIRTEIYKQERGLRDLQVRELYIHNRIEINKQAALVEECIDACTFPQWGHASAKASNHVLGSDGKGGWKLIKEVRGSILHCRRTQLESGGRNDVPVGSTEFTIAILALYITELTGFRWGLPEDTPYDREHILYPKRILKDDDD